MTLPERLIIVIIVRDNGEMKIFHYLSRIWIQTYFFLSTTYTYLKSPFIVDYKRLGDGCGGGGGGGERAAEGKANLLCGLEEAKRRDQHSEERRSFSPLSLPFSIQSRLTNFGENVTMMNVVSALRRSFRRSKSGNKSNNRDEDETAAAGVAHPSRGGLGVEEDEEDEEEEEIGIVRKEWAEDKATRDPDSGHDRARVSQIIEFLSSPNQRVVIKVRLATPTLGICNYIIKSIRELSSALNPDN